jgi:E3 ubiquitin-protein ligase UBR4
VVALVSSMIKESTHLKGIIQHNVNIVIKSFLKIRKLNLTKNKVIQNSETEIEKMFNELHSQRDEEKANFILQCIKLIESEDCDSQEMRFLFEEICKVIDPVKPEPEYKLQLKGTPSQQDFIKKMQKNSYTSNQLGKTLNEVRNKICLETDLQSPELLDLLVDNKIVSMDLTIKQVYEQVHWPSVCRQRNPDAYDIPNIDDAPRDQLKPMIVVYRLTGIDGEATEDRIDTL